ncbi:NAD(P)-dependent oxidoreductase [Pseudomonas sp. NY15181]|uniref:NAD(P)-dependent oxidoreductase n=1 Tax=Pseudomonas sp. NY15181 TaxID=3400349 RepID=UPI003A8C6A62
MGNIVGVLGCGVMGRAIAITLASAGFKVGAWNRSFDAAQRLERFGVHAYESLEDLVCESDIVLSVLSNYDVVSSVVHRVAHKFKGRVLVNLTSGFSESALEMDSWARENKINYLDGTIWTLPDEIGKRTTALSFSGSREVWESIESVAKVLGGRAFYVGENVALANVMEAAFPGAFYMSSILSFLEGVRLAKSYGVEKKHIEAAIDPVLELLRTSAVDCLERAFSGNFSESQACIGVLANAVNGYSKNKLALPRPPMFSALQDALNKAVADGLGAVDVSVLSLH